MRQPKPFRDTPGSVVSEVYHVKLVFFNPKTNSVHNDSYPEYDPWWAMEITRYAPDSIRGFTKGRFPKWILFNGEAFYVVRLWEDGLYHLARSSGRFWRLTVEDKKHLQDAVAKYLEEQLGEPVYHTKILCRA